MQLIIQIILQFFFLTIDHLLCFRKGGRVSLGCVVDTGLCGDYHSVKWYRQGARLAVISHDYRWASGHCETPCNLMPTVRHPVI